jgi:hypothetical protein
MPDIFDNDTIQNERDIPRDSRNALLDCRKSYDVILSAKTMNEHTNMWVAAYKGELVAIANDHEGLLHMLDEQSIPSGFAAIGYVPWLIDEAKGS